MKALFKVRSKGGRNLEDDVASLKINSFLFNQIDIDIDLFEKASEGEEDNDDDEEDDSRVTTRMLRSFFARVEQWLATSKKTS